MNRYSVSIIEGAGVVEFESLPVAKITDYPVEKRDYKPYAQVSLGVNDEYLAFSLAAFEVKPNEDSEIGAVLYLTPDEGSKKLEVWVTPETTSVYIKSADGDKEVIDAKSFSKTGEDLQGIYWGYDIMVSREAVNKISGLNIEAGETIKGNFFKIQTSMPEHYGSFSRVDSKNPYEIHSMGELVLVSY